MLDPAHKATRDFILANTGLQAPPHVPEINLHLADEAHDLWHRTEEELATIGLPPPFWAFAWAGGQGVARYILDHPETVFGKTVLDFASGSGLVAIAAMKSGANSVIASDIDPFALPAIEINAAANNVAITPTLTDLIDQDHEWEVVLAGDVFYEKPLADRLIPWFSKLAERGARIIVGDPGRSYLPKDRLEQLAVYTVPVTRALEDAEVKRTTVWTFL
ncbi:methyltransferase [Brucella pseudogrignonensis]|uniref:Nicotinamide N-methyase n=1 Tax=Brucella pseudogrignonensis TaxID=419475 RepID=A0ABU1MA57_9HYPH|nr:methyltransferase [Brucella pseudogrignonensis]MDR6432914.1 putative nicotinamide N-methyase [Brucella pseudogrignonensis]